MDKWERTLSLILEVTEMILTVQRQWMYLEVLIFVFRRINASYMFHRHSRSHVAFLSSKQHQLMLSVLNMPSSLILCTLFVPKNIFLGEDIRKQLPRESAEFDDVNANWKVGLLQIRHSVLSFPT